MRRSTELVCPVCCIVINGPEQVGLIHEHCGCANRAEALAYDRLSVEAKLAAVSGGGDQ